MKTLPTLILTLLVLGGCGDSEPKSKTINISLDSTVSDTTETDNGKAAWYVVMNSPKQESNVIQNSPKDIVLEALFDRCEEFGWLSEEDISACIKQEAFRDLQMQEQQYQMRLMERRLASNSSSNSNNTVVQDRPVFLEILTLLAQNEQAKQSRQMQKDIQALKSANRSMKKRQNTQAALKFLYQGKR